MATPSVIIDFEPNWDSEPELSYGFLTAIQGTPYFKEQRRPMVPTLSRIQSCKFTFIDEAMQRARNVLLYGAPRLCYVPIYSEPIQAAAVTQGASAITASTDITYYWNLQNCDYAVILDFLTGQSEAVVVASVAGQVITLTGAIVQAWDAATCVIYPAFPGKISAVKENAVTSRLLELDAQFEEVTIGEEATKVWVGLDEQVCPATPPNIGSVWESVYDTGGYELRSIKFLSGQILVAGSYPGCRVYRSADNGVTWTNLGKPSGLNASDYTITSFAYCGSGVVVAGVEPYGAIARSTDYGLTWGVSWGLGFALIHSVEYLGSGVVLAGSSTGRIFRSTNSGASWSDLGVKITGGSIRSITDVGNGVVLAGGPTTTSPYSAKIIRSTDYGITWSTVHSYLVPPYSYTYLFALKHAGSGHCIAGGGPEARFVVSADSGVTWVDAGRITKDYIYSLESGGFGLVVAGCYGTGISTLIQRSTDYGQSFENVDSIPSLGQAYIYAITKSLNEFFCVTDTGRIFKSSN
jgi:hypothetical protein